MNKKQNVKIPLTDIEKKTLRSKKIRIRDLQELGVEEIETVLEVSCSRAKEIYALATFQAIPSLGVKFAEDLIFLGYYSLD